MTAARWDGKVTPLIKDAKSRLARLSDKKVNGWFDVPKQYGHLFQPALVHAEGTLSDPKTAKGLGHVEVAFTVHWPKLKNAPDASVLVVYRNGDFEKIRRLTKTVGSLGFRKPKLELPKAIRHAQQFKTKNPDVIPSKYRIHSARLEKAETPEPGGGRLRWVIAYDAPGKKDVRVIVPMAGKARAEG